MLTSNPGLQIGEQVFNLVNHVSQVELEPGERRNLVACFNPESAFQTLGTTAQVRFGQVSRSLGTLQLSCRTKDLSFRTWRVPSCCLSRMSMTR